MIRHAVYFKFKPDTSNSAQAQHIDDFAALKDAIAEIKGYEWGRTVKGPDARNGLEYDVAHFVLFDDVQSIFTYFDHPDHQSFIERNKSVWESVKVVDSEISVS